MAIFNPSLFAMARKQELIDEEVRKDSFKKSRVIPDDAAALIVTSDEAADFVTLTLMGTAEVQQEGKDVPLTVLVTMQALRLLQEDLDNNLCIPLNESNEEPS